MGELARQGRIDPRKYPKYQPHYLTQCIGQERAIDVQTRIVPIDPPGRLFLYSDGCLPKTSLSDLHHLLRSESSPQVFLDRIERQIYDEGPRTTTPASPYSSHKPLQPPPRQQAPLR